MSASTSLKDQLKVKIAALDSVQEVYGHEEINPSGWPAVVVTAADMDGEFSSNAENSRVYSFRCQILFPTGQDFIRDSSMNRLEYAEQTVATVVDEIIGTMDTDFTLAGGVALYMNAADATWGYISGEFGEARSCSITLRVYQEVTVV